MVVMAAVVSSRRKCRGELLARDSDMRVYCTKFFNTVSGSHHIFAACSSDLSRTTSPNLRGRILVALHTVPSILSSGGSRLLIYCTAHAALEARLARTFRSPVALLFNFGFDANAGFFASVPQAGNGLLHDEIIHALVRDGVRVSWVAPRMRRPSRTTTWVRCAPGSLGRVRYAQEVHERRVCRSRERV